VSPPHLTTLATWIPQRVRDVRADQPHARDHTDANDCACHRQHTLGATNDTPSTGTEQHNTMTDANRTRITFRPPADNTRWDVLLTQETTTVYRVFLDDADLDYVFNPADMGNLAATLKSEALRLLAEGRATLIGQEIPPATVEYWAPAERSDTQEALGDHIRRITETATGTAEELAQARAVVHAAAIWHAARRNEAISDEVHGLLPTATAVLIDVREWFDHRGRPQVLHARGVNGALDTDHLDWPDLRDRIVDHLLAALEHLGPHDQPGWQHIDADDLHLDDLDTEDADLFEVRVTGLDWTVGLTTPPPQHEA
jgi:hypothetical protein